MIRRQGADRHRRAQARDKALEASVGLLKGSDASGDAPDVEAIERALASLPVEQREVVVLRIYEGRSFKEIAAQTESPLGTVHSRYRYALAKLRRTLNPEGE